MIVNGAPLVPEWASAFTPPPLLTVSQWADANRILPESSAAAGARWRTDAVPYLRGIMDAPLEPGVRKIAIRKAAQVGGSEAVNNIIGYFMEYDPCPMLLIHATEGDAEEYSKQRLAGMIRSSPALSAAVDDSESTLTLKMFAGGYLALGGANSPNMFARRAARLATGDDVDRWPPVVGEEGDPADLLQKRVTTFDTGLVMYVSTPVLKGGRIDTLYNRSDRRHYFVQCPMCGRWDYTTWQHPEHFSVRFDQRDPWTARFECPSEEYGGCGARLSESDRRRMVAAGDWRQTAVAQEPGLVGFHLPAMVTTLGDASLSTWVTQFLAARENGKESLRVFINTTLAEGWEDRGARMEPSVLYQRREDYGEDVEIPAAAAALTAGVDVQEDRFELLVTAWGLAGERWVVDWRSIPGNPKRAETRAALLEALGRKYPHALGVQLPIHATCIDTGYATQEMYDFVLAYQGRRIFATKGVGGKSAEPIVSKPTEKRYGKNPRPVRLYWINTDDAKADVMSSLALVAPGPGYIHFPSRLESITEEFFAQLCAEHKETRYNKAGVATHVVWVQDRDRNEALDCAVLNLAAHRLLNPNIRQMLEQIEAAAVDLQTPAPVRAPMPVPVSPPPTTGRRISRSSYLTR